MKTRSFVNRTATLKRRNATIKHLKKENKTLLKTIQEIQISNANALQNLIEDYSNEIMFLQKELNQTQDALKESQRKKWYQFIPKIINYEIRTRKIY